MNDAPRPHGMRDTLKKVLTLGALTVGAVVGLSVNLVGSIGGLFSPQARVSQQNDRIATAVGLIGVNTVHADGGCGSCSCDGSGAGACGACGCNCDGACGGGGCGGCGGCGG